MISITAALLFPYWIDTGILRFTAKMVKEALS